MYTLFFGFFIYLKLLKKPSSPGVDDTENDEEIPFTF